MVKGSFNVVIGAQAGSEAKGKLSAYLVEKFKPEVLTMASSPNAGHTVVVGDRKLVTYHLPAGLAKANYGVTVVLGPSSIIRPDIFHKELVQVSKWAKINRLVIDPRATIITPGMVKTEEGILTKIGSTAQGVGMARVARIMRVGTVRMADIWDNFKSMSESGVMMVMANSASHLHKHLNSGSTVLHESTQGFDLCLDHGLDPTYCTTRNITTGGALAEMGIPPCFLGDVYGVMRPYPIRVNNRDGYSGPYADAVEITWDSIRQVCGAPHDITEMTTTTKLERRVFTLSWPRLRYFHRICDPNYLCLQFANYIDWSVYGSEAVYGSEVGIPYRIAKFIDELQTEFSPIAYIGTGPDHTHMIDMGIDYA